MIIYKTIEPLRIYVRKQKKEQKSIGFIPTMGALHAGHISLINTSTLNKHITVCSIFINPTQFNNAADFNKYPVTIEKDIKQLEEAGCDILFLPDKQTIYPPEFETQPFNLGYLEEILEGKYRPGHFQGVCQVVNRLLEIISPDVMFLGEKDYQQCMVIKKMAGHLFPHLQIIVHNTLRETDGLAMSSRNLRLTLEERIKAPAIYKALKHIADGSEVKKMNSLLQEARFILSETGFRVEYLEIADADTLLPVSESSARKVILIAAYLGDIRLIDNLVITS